MESNNNLQGSNNLQGNKDIRNNENIKNCENIKKSEDKKGDNKNTKLVKLAMILLICVILIVIFVFAYAKYTTTVTGTATAEIATMICEMEVQASEPDKNIINPYCMVTVKNYNKENKITETQVKYKIEVTPKGDFTLPEYYWKNSEGIIIAQSTEVTGTFEIGAKDEEEYKIVFLNAGEEDIVRNVNFNLVAVQRKRFNR